MAEKADAIIRNLRILAEGCRKHPAYRARRPATGRCEPCVRMYEARLALTKLDGENGKS
jgi:hypothetical protein